MGRKRSRGETEAEQLTADLTEALSRANLAIVLVDRDWKVTYFNEVAESYIPQRRGLRVGRSVWALSPHLTRDTELGAAMISTMDSGLASQTRLHSPTFRRWVAIDVHPTQHGIAIHARDIDEDQLTRAKLDEHTGRLKAQGALLDAARDAILVRDLDHRISYWNRGAERLYGWTSEEAMGQSARDLLYDEPTGFDLHMAEVLDVGYWSGELEQRTRDGRTIVADCRWQLVRDDDGTPSFVFAVISDITEFKRAQMKEYRAQRMESLGTLAGGIAHDLNNVFTPILMASQLLSESEADPDRRELLESIESGAVRGADMIRQVLAFARGEEGEHLTLDVSALVARTANFCRDALPKSISVSTEVEPPLLPVIGDSTQIMQILMNLVTNARDAMPTGGALTIRARVIREPLEPGLPEQSWVAIEVEDSGVGMDEETAARVFEPFFTTKEVGSGTGLGLSTSMAIARGHGGDLELYSELGVGTKFRLSLPASEEGSTSPPTTTISAVDFARGHGERVLVVDDEATIRQIVRQTLEANGYEVLVAANGLEAVDQFEADSHIDLVLTDMMMPLMDGAALAEYIREHHPDIPIIAASGLNANGGVARSASAGVTRFLSKPFTTLELLHAVRGGIRSESGQS